MCRFFGVSIFSLGSCKVCEQYEENLTHLFYLCSSAKKIWNYVNSLIRRRFPTYQEYQINFKDVLCDFQDHNELRNNPVTGLLRDLGLRHCIEIESSMITKNQKLSVFLKPNYGKKSKRISSRKSHRKNRNIQEKLGTPQLTYRNTK